MKNGLVDVVELIFNIFEQEPVAELLSAAKENTAISDLPPLSKELIEKL